MNHVFFYEKPDNQSVWLINQPGKDKSVWQSVRIVYHLIKPLKSATSFASLIKTNMQQHYIKSIFLKI